MKPFSEACEQNKIPILTVLQQEFRDCRQVLEIGSGTGQHAAYFGPKLNWLRWQTSELMENLPGIRQWLEDYHEDNVLEPVLLDVETGPWAREQYDGVFSANTAHIMNWNQVQAMFAGINRALKQDGIFCLYGPFNYGGHYTSESNARFDAWLKQQDACKGIRNYEDLNGLAVSQGWELTNDHRMPANNRTLVWRKLLNTA